MTQTIEVESIRRLDVKPGETLVFTLPARCTMADADRVKRVAADVLPGVAILVVGEGTQLQVVANTDVTP